MSYITIKLNNYDVEPAMEMEELIEHLGQEWPDNETADKFILNSRVDNADNAFIAMIFGIVEAGIMQKAVEIQKIFPGYEPKTELWINCKDSKFYLNNTPITTVEDYKDATMKGLEDLIPNAEQEEFDKCLHQKAETMSVSEIMDFAGIYEILSEELNTEILEELQTKYADIAANL